MVDAADLGLLQFQAGDCPAVGLPVCAGLRRDLLERVEGRRRNPVNAAPVVTTHDQTPAKNALIDARHLFDVTDADFDTIEKFAFWDDVARPESGSFVLDGVAQSAQQEIVVDAADLALLQFQAGESRRGGTTSMCGRSTGPPGASGRASA